MPLVGSGRTAFGADARHHQVDLFGFEVVAVAEMAADALDKVSLVMINLPADPAHQMEVVVRVTQLPPRALVGPEARLSNQVEISEQGKAAIDRGSVDRRISLMHLSDNLLNGEMPTGAVEDFPNPETGLGESVPPIAE